MQSRANDAGESAEQPYELLFTGPAYLQQFVVGVAQHQASLHASFALPPVQVATRVVDDFVAEVNATSARSLTPLQSPFHDARAGDSVVVAKNMPMTADRSRVEILFNSEAPILREPENVADLADLVWLVSHEMSHPLFGQLRAVTRDVAAEFPLMTGRRSLRRSLLDALDEFRCERIAEYLVEELVQIDDAGVVRGVTAVDMGDRYAGPWGACVRDTVVRLNMLARNSPVDESAWVTYVYRLLATTNDLVGLSARAASYGRLTLSRFDGDSACAFVVEAMDAIWQSVDELPFGYTLEEFGSIERSFITVAEGEIARLWNNCAIGIELDDPRLVGLA